MVGRNDPNCVRIPATAAAAQTAFSTRIIQQIAARYPNVRAFLPANVLCDSEYCHAERNGHLLYWDAGHLNQHGTFLVGEAVRKAMQDWTPERR
jgi:hypothetical protein